MQWADPECTMALDSALLVAVAQTDLCRGIYLLWNGPRTELTTEQRKMWLDLKSNWTDSPMQKYSAMTASAEWNSSVWRCTSLWKSKGESTLSLILCFFFNPFTPIPNHAFCHRFTTSQFHHDKPVSSNILGDPGNPDHMIEENMWRRRSLLANGAIFIVFCIY